MERECNICQRMKCRLQMAANKSICYLCEKKYMHKIVYQFATRSRPVKFDLAVKSIIDHSILPFKIHAVLDSDDETMTGRIDNEFITYDYGISKTKIEAINRNIPSGQVLINMSDDMLFKVKGFDKIIIDSFAGDFDQLLHFPDGYVNEKLITMSIIGSDYFNRFGYIYHSDYKSLWCDNEAMEVAKKLGKYKYIGKHLFVHNHPAWTRERPDKLLIKTNSYYQEDMITYQRRKREGFPLKSCL